MSDPIPMKGPYRDPLPGWSIRLRGSEINGITVNTVLKYLMKHVPFMLQVSVQYIRTLEKSGVGEYSILIFKKAKAGGEGGDRG